MNQTLIVVAVQAEADAITHYLGSFEPIRIGPYEAFRSLTHSLTVVAGGIGPAASAAATATLLAISNPYDRIVSAGIGGGFESAGVKLREVVVATRICFADLGAHSPERFLDAASLGWSGSVVDSPLLGVTEICRRIERVGVHVHAGPIVTVSAATGTAARAAELAGCHAAFAEGMEGAGVATAAARFGKPVFELRAISNAIGDRNVAAWDIPGALAVLATAVAALVDKPA